MKSGRRKFIVTPETAIRFTKTSVLLTYIFAPPSADKLRVFLFRIFMVTSVLISVTFFLSLALSIFENSDKLVIVIKSLMFMSSLVNYVGKVVIVRIYCESFQRLQLTINNFVKNADKLERSVLQKYVNKCWKFQLFVTLGSYFAPTGLLLGTLVLPQKFPTDAVYPFSTENSIISTIVYLHQSIGGYHASAAVVLDCQMAVYLWYFCARFEALNYQIKYVEDHRQLKLFIKKHQSLLLFVDETLPSIRAVVFSTITVNKFIMTCAAVVLISSKGVIEKVQCGIIAVFTALNIYTFIRPADRLIEITSYDVSNRIFAIFWIWTLEMKKTCLLILHRTQNPVVITIPGFLEIVSNRYYAAFLSAAFSFFTAIRAIVNS